MSDMEARVEKLERENRRIKRAGLAGLLVVAGAALMGQAAPSQVAAETRTRLVVLEDETGKVRAKLEVGRTGRTTLALFDETERVRVMVSASRNGSGVWLMDETAEPRAKLIWQKEGPSLHLNSGADTAQLAVTKDGPSLGLKDQQGYRATLGSAAPVPTTSGTSAPRSAASLILLGKDGKATWQAP